jgi:GNAT superfamily N-acetyltransferase
MNSKSVVIEEGYSPGCVGRIVELHGVYYATHQVIEGSIAIDGSDASCARLRWFIVSDALQGTGVGTRLIQAAIEFCRSRGYPRVQLATFGTLSAAIHLYVKHGFRLVHEERGAN